MAKVNVEYDTVDKTASVTIDGKPMKNLASISVYCGYSDDDNPKFCLEAATVEYDKEHDMRTVNRIMASVKDKKPTVAQQIQNRIFSSAYSVPKNGIVNIPGA